VSRVRRGAHDIERLDAPRRRDRRRPGAPSRRPSHGRRAVPL